MPKVSRSKRKKFVAAVTYVPMNLWHIRSYMYRPHIYIVNIWQQLEIKTEKQTRAYVMSSRAFCTKTKHMNEGEIHTIYDYI